MSKNMYLYVLPDDHIKLIKEHNLCFPSYADGDIPEFNTGFFSKLFGINQPLDLPENWPNSEIELFDPGIVSSQIDLYHYLLNGSEEFVSHEGCLFQTWYINDDKGSAIKIDGDTFAFTSELLSALSERLNEIDGNLITKRTEEFLGDVPSDDEVEVLLYGFTEIKKAVSKCMALNEGLVWYGN